MFVMLRARSSSSTEMMCCSWDGTVAYFEFTVDEIGKPMSLEEKVCKLKISLIATL